MCRGTGSGAAIILLIDSHHRGRRKGLWLYATPWILYTTLTRIPAGVHFNTPPSDTILWHDTLKHIILQEYAESSWANGGVAFPSVYRIPKIQEKPTRHRIIATWAECVKEELGTWSCNSVFCPLLSVEEEEKCERSFQSHRLLHLLLCIFLPLLTSDQTRDGMKKQLESKHI